MLQVHCDGAHFMPRLLAGSYEPIGKMLRGKKVYKKAGFIQKVCLYFFVGFSHLFWDGVCAINAVYMICFMF